MHPSGTVGSDRDFYKVNSISDKLEQWKEELAIDIDKEFLLTGIENGFRITDIEDFSTVKQVYCSNHTSVKTHSVLVEKELRDQIECGNYILAKDTPTPVIVSPMGAILKEGKK